MKRNIRNNIQNVVELKRKRDLPSFANIVSYIFMAPVVGYVLLAASKIIDAIKIFLFTSPSAQDANQKITEGFVKAIETSLKAFIIFSIVCLLVILINRNYIRLSIKGLILILIAYFCWQIGAIGLYFLINMEVLFLWGILFALVGLKIVGWGAHIFKKSMQNMVRTADDVIKRSSTPPIIYLRAFLSDKMNAPQKYDIKQTEFSPGDWPFASPINPVFWIERRELTFEEIICKGFRASSPVIAIGQPGERLPKLGAFRKYVNEYNWKSEVIRLLKLCRFACFVVGSSKGLIWEFQKAIEICPITKLLLIIPPDDSQNSNWSLFVNEIEQLESDIFLPVSLPISTIAIAFNTRKIPIIITGRMLVSNYKDIASLITKNKW